MERRVGELKIENTFFITWDSDVTIMMLTKFLPHANVGMTECPPWFRRHYFIWAQLSLQHGILGRMHKIQMIIWTSFKIHIQDPGTNLSVIGSGSSWLHYLMSTIEEMYVCTPWGRKCARTRHWWQHFLDTNFRTINARLTWPFLSESQWCLNSLHARWNQLCLLTHCTHRNMA